MKSRPHNNKNTSGVSKTNKQRYNKDKKVEGASVTERHKSTEGLEHNRIRFVFRKHDIYVHITPLNIARPYPTI